MVAFSMMNAASPRLSMRMLRATVSFSGTVPKSRTCASAQASLADESAMMQVWYARLGSVEESALVSSWVSGVALRVELFKVPSPQPAKIKRPRHMEIAFEYVEELMRAVPSI